MDVDADPWLHGHARGRDGDTGAVFGRCKDGKLDFSFKLKKDKTEGKTLAAVATTVANLIP